MGDGELGKRDADNPPAKRQVMSREAQTAWIVGAIVAVGLVIAATVANKSPGNEYAQTKGEGVTDPLSPVPSSEAQADAAITDAGGALEAKHAEFDDAMGDLYSGVAPRASVDRELEMGSR